MLHPTDEQEAALRLGGQVELECPFCGGMVELTHSGGIGVYPAHSRTLFGELARHFVSSADIMGCGMRPCQGSSLFVWGRP